MANKKNEYTSNTSNTRIFTILEGFLIIVLIVSIFITIGTIGYHMFGKNTWINVFHNASLIFPGCGLAHPLKADTGKIFSSIYALVSNLVVLIIIGFIVGNIVADQFETEDNIKGIPIIDD